MPGATGPDAIHQAYGLAANLVTEQAAILAFMDYFHLLGLVMLAGLPLAFFIRRFEIAKPVARPIRTWGRPAYEIGRSSGAAR
jgi:hypothetical protein